MTLKGYPCAFLSDRYLILPKLLYFTLNVLLYSTYIFAPQYFSTIWHISDHHYGYLIAFCVLSFVGSILWTMLADKTGQHKLILILSTLGYSLSFFLLRTNLLVDAPDSVRIPFVAICFGLSNFFTSAHFPLLDNRILVLLSEDPRFTKELFGRQRLFGTVGQSIVTLISGYTILQYGIESIFVILLVSTVFFILLIVLAIPSRATPSRQIDYPSIDTQPATLSQSIGKLLASFDYMFFLLIILVAGTTRGVIGNYLTRYFDKVLHMSPWETSVILQARIVTEIAIFFLGKQMLQSIGKHWMLIIAQFTGFLRVIAYAYMPTNYPWTMLPFFVELLKGINNATLIAAGVQYVHEYAPPGLEATAQGLFSGSHNYLSNAASGFIGAVILKHHQHDPNPYQILFRYTSVLAFGGMVMFISKWIIGNQGRYQAPSDANQEEARAKCHGSCEVDHDISP